MMETIKPIVLIFPDIHGRTFWKSALKQYSKDEYPDLDIVFLGDYLDPYESFDGITKGEAYNNFLEIVDEAKNDSRIKLLLGNHDWHYFHFIDSCRMDMERVKKIEQIFKDNMNLFFIAYQKEIDGTNYLFTHAGMLNGWLEYVKNLSKNMLERENENYDHKEFLLKIIKFDIKKDNAADFLNMFNNDDEFYSFPLSMISQDRGGRFYYGSPIWADVHEHLLEDESITQYYQIFGHTISFPNGSAYEYYISKDKNKPFAMIDSSRAFVLYNNKEIKPV